MTIIRTSLIAAFGMLAAAMMTPASAGALVTAKPAQDSVAFAQHDVAGVHVIGDRGSWKKPRSRFKRGHAYGYDLDDRYRPHKHFKKKKKFYRRGFRRGYDRGYDQGYYDGRRHSRFRHHHYPKYGYRGGVFFNDGYSAGGGFRFRF